MRSLTVDASVAVKWFLAGAPDEADVERAIAILLALRESRVALVQPAHWKAEVAAVLARREPDLTLDCVADLLRLTGVTTVDSDAQLLAASQLAVDLREHVFDTLYHATAAEFGTTLVTADERYFRRARAADGMVLLRNFTLS